MNRRSLLALGLFATGASLAGAASAAAKRGRGWITLFDGKSLKNWDQIGTANWRLADGAAQADMGNGYLVSKQTFDDFELKAEFWVDADANSGVFIRCTDPGKIGSENAYEVNIWDTRPDPSYGTGAIVNVAKVDPMPKTAGRWSTMEIKAQGTHFHVAVNGVTTVADGEDSAHAHGRIGLQYAAGVVKFRKVLIRPI